MSRKDYEAIAAAIRNQASELSVCSPEFQYVSNIANDIANHCVVDNPRFDRAKFLAACEVA